MLLQTALAAETHLAEGLTLKLWCTVKVEKSLTDLVGDDDDDDDNNNNNNNNNNNSAAVRYIVKHSSDFSGLAAHY
jgi:hypothetical protein